MLSKLTRGGQLIQNTYDTLDRMVTHLVPQPVGVPATVTSHAYDLVGRTTQISDNTGHILAYAFDTAKRLISVTQTAPYVSGTRQIAYRLDAADNKTRVTWADGYFVDYAFDALGRMTTATENGTYLLATYLYDPLSRRTSLVTGNGAVQSYTYTMQGDLLTLAHAMTATSVTYTNAFNKAHQLASEEVSNAAWQYQPAAFQTTSYSPANNLNQYVNVTVGGNPTATMAYDANGNLTGDGTWTFAYDSENRLKTATSTGTSAAYAYDPLGRRQAKTVDTVVTTFLSDGDEEIADYAESGGVSTLLRRYVPGPGTDMPIAMVTPSGGGNVRAYFHVNRQGSTIAMSADDGTVSEGPYTYDAYGNGAPATGVPFKYAGRRLDAETGIYYNRARYYSPNLGRFLQTDSVGYADDTNLYGFVGNDPVNKYDPDGRSALRINYRDQKIHIPAEYGGGTFLQSVSGGHSGVVTIYDASGATRYQEFGRYGPHGESLVKSRSVSNFQFIGGVPTKRSVVKMLNDILAIGRANGSQDIVVRFTLSGRPDAMQREAASWGSREWEINPFGPSTTCHTFADSVAAAGGDGPTIERQITPQNVDQVAQEIVDMYQKQADQKKGNKGNKGQSRGGVNWSIDDDWATGERCTGRKSCNN